jgi:hypothetical protein
MGMGDGGMGEGGWGMRDHMVPSRSQTGAIDDL